MEMLRLFWADYLEDFGSKAPNSWTLTINWEGATHKTKMAKNYENWHLPTSIYLHWIIEPDTSCNQFQRCFGMILELFRKNMNTAMHA
jgi:hypothetical protein